MHLKHHGDCTARILQPTFLGAKVYDVPQASIRASSLEFPVLAWGVQPLRALLHGSFQVSGISVVAISHSRLQDCHIPPARAQSVQPCQSCATITGVIATPKHLVPRLSSRPSRGPASRLLHREQERYAIVQCGRPSFPDGRPAPREELDLASGVWSIEICASECGNDGL